MDNRDIARQAFEQGQGILRLKPAWVPRVFCVPGRRIKLHPDDYYALGNARGGLDERWLSSTTPADNGPLTSHNEGLSYVVLKDKGSVKQILLREAVDILRDGLIGDRLWKLYGGWPMYSKFFDNQGPLPHHVHHRDEHARLVGQAGKPEAYYFPVQLNNHGGDFPYTFFGLEPGTTRSQIRECLKLFTKGDNRITSYSKAYRLEPGTGWNVPPGVLHAPGSLCTYEPQKASDVFAMYQSIVNKQVIPEELLWKNTPQQHVGNVDYLLDVLDWERNIDPQFHLNNFMRPLPVEQITGMKEKGYCEYWICYKSDAFSAKELTIMPGRSATLFDQAAYGMIMLQGHGTMGTHRIETPSLIRYGQLTYDEFFISESAALSGVKIINESASDPIVMLKHFGPENPQMQPLRENV